MNILFLIFFRLINIPYDKLKYCFVNIYSVVLFQLKASKQNSFDVKSLSVKPARHLNPPVCLEKLYVCQCEVHVRDPQSHPHSQPSHVIAISTQVKPKRQDRQQNSRWSTVRLPLAIGSRTPRRLEGQCSRGRRWSVYWCVGVRRN